MIRGTLEDGHGFVLAAPVLAHDDARGEIDRSAGLHRDPAIFSGLRVGGDAQRDPDHHRGDIGIPLSSVTIPVVEGSGLHGVEVDGGTGLVVQSQGDGQDAAQPVVADLSHVPGPPGLIFDVRDPDYCVGALGFQAGSFIETGLDFVHLLGLSGVAGDDDVFAVTVEHDSAEHSAVHGEMFGGKLGDGVQHLGDVLVVEEDLVECSRKIARIGGSYGRLRPLLGGLPPSRGQLVPDPTAQHGSTLIRGISRVCSQALYSPTVCRLVLEVLRPRALDSLFKDCPVEHSSRVVIEAAGLAGPIRLQVLGCLTLETVSTVTEILERGAAFISCPDLVVDLRDLEHLDPVGLAALELYIDQQRTRSGLPRITTSLLPCDCQVVSA